MDSLSDNIVSVDDKGNGVNWRPKKNAVRVER